MVNKVHYCRVMHKAGKKLQRTRGISGYLDHLPLMMSMRYAFAPRRKEELWPENFLWDFDKLAMGIFHGYKKREFLDKLQQSLDLSDVMPDDAWESFMRNIKTAAKECYSRTNKPDIKGWDDMQNKRTDLLKKRAKWRKKANQSGVIDELDEIKVKLAGVTNDIKEAKTAGMR